MGALNDRINPNTLHKNPLIGAIAIAMRGVADLSAMLSRMRQVYLPVELAPFNVTDLGAIAPTPMTQRIKPTCRLRANPCFNFISNFLDVRSLI